MAQNQFLSIKPNFSPHCWYPMHYTSSSDKVWKLSFSTLQKMASQSKALCALKENHQNNHSLIALDGSENKLVKKSGKKQHHLWKKRDSTGSGQKALSLVQIISRLPNEKEAVYGALDKWVAWETEFPLIAAAKALRILTKRSQWKRVIQVAKWMLSKGQGDTMATYDCLLMAFNMEGRMDEATDLWNMILHKHTRSISKRLFSRIIALYHHHNMPDNVIEVFGDMEEFGVRPDEDTLRRIARAFEALGEFEKRRLALNKYQMPYKYIHFKGERVRVRNRITDEMSSLNSKTPHK